MKYILIVINTLLISVSFPLLGNDTLILNGNTNSPIRFHRLYSAQQKYLSWIDKKHRDFPFGLPAIAYNKYDGIQIGAALINLKQPVKHLDFTSTLLYGIASKKINGTANLQYSIQPKKSVVSLIQPGLQFQSFSYYDNPKVLKYYKISPSLTLNFRHRSEKLEKYEHTISFRNHTVFQKDLTYFLADINTIAFKDTLTRFYANVIQYTFKRNDVNFPFSASLNIEQSRYFIKASFEANSFIRYQLKDYKTGVHLRLFAGGFMWRSNDYRFRRSSDVGFNLNGKRGEQDYLYNDFYIGRNEQENFAGRQITKSDGFFKVSTPLNSVETGQTVDWLLAMNIRLDFPVKYVPLKLFFDLGYSYDNHLNPNNILPVKGFQYDGGFMFSFFDEGFEIYFPLFYSKEYKQYYKSNAPKFGQRVSFLLDIHKLELHRIIRNMKF